MAFSRKCSKHVLSSIFLCRSGTEEDYSVLSQLLDDISTYCRDCIEAKQIEKERNKKKEETDRKQAEHIRKSAMGNLGCKTSVFILILCLGKISGAYVNSSEQ